MKRSSDAIIDLTEEPDNENEREPIKKKTKTTEKQEKANESLKVSNVSNGSVDLTLDEDEEEKDGGGKVDGKISKFEAAVAGASFWCEVCKVSSTSQRNHDEHMKGGKHAKKVRTSKGSVCEPCDLRFPHNTALNNHEQSRQHRVKVAEQGSSHQGKGSSHHGSPSPSTIRRGGQGAEQRGNSRNSFSGFGSGSRSFGNSHQDFPSPDVFSHPSPAFRQRLCPDPDAFRPVAEMLCCPVDLQFALQGAGKYSRLTEDMVELFNCRQQRLVTMNQKIALWSEIYRAVRTDVDASLFVFGSTFNGFGAEGCDIDMCLFPQGMLVSDKQWLSRVRGLLQRHCGHFIKGRIELINAKVPILKFFDRTGGLEVDLSVNNPTSIRNTHLLFCYSQADYRVRPLVLAVKRWAKEHGINEARFQTLSSYSLTLMVLHFLQSGVFPPVLPCLQEELPEVFNSNSEITSLPYQPPPWASRNRQSLGELLCGFFSYYAGGRNSFDPRTDVASVRCGMVLDQRDCEDYARLHKLGQGQWSARILLEEPFDRTNAARAVCSDQKWAIIMEALLSTKEVVDHGGSGLGLADLGPSNSYRR